MNDYRKVDFILVPNSETESDILSALICDIGFESFVPNENGVVAYIKDELFSPDAIFEAIELYPFNAQINWAEEFVEGRDWNEEWEKNYFTPILIADRCVIHSTFHVDYPKAEYEILINPKMAFGTGHHETTTMMVENILDSNMQGKRILDVGTGTGILAILAAKRGASHICGIEIDPMAYENALENININNVDQVEILLGDASLINNDMPQVDMVLANINRNIILNDIATYSSILDHGGLMQLSGFYDDDIPALLEAATANSLQEIKRIQKSRWAMLLLKKQ